MGILTVLQSKRFVTAEFLANRFSISIRTVYRDMKALNEIGIPIGFEHQKGYFIVKGYFIPPITFTEEEANALILMESVADKFGDQSIKKHYQTALDKVKVVLKEPLKEHVEHLHSQIKVYKNPVDSYNIHYLAEIQKSITNKTILNIEYKNNQQEISKREVEPIGLTYYASNWHAIAWCWKRNAYRDFKLTHILHLNNTQRPFKKNQHIDMNTYIKSLN